jgi:hypothetical protein
MKPTLSFLVLFSLLFLFSCHNNSNQKYIEANLSDTASITGVTGDSVKLVKTAGVHFKVQDVEAGAKAVSALATQMGGMVFSHNMEAVEEDRKELKVADDSLLVITAYTPQAQITARVPLERLEEFLHSVVALGYHTASSRMDIEDKSLIYLSNALKQQNRSQVLSKAATGKPAGGATVTQVVDLKDQGVNQQVNNMAIDADVRYSLVNLTLFQNPLVRKEVITNTNLADYRLPFGSRVAEAFSAGWDYFLNVVMLIANLWVFIVFAVSGYLLYRTILRKRKLA